MLQPPTTPKEMNKTDDEIKDAVLAECEHLLSGLHYSECQLSPRAELIRSSATPRNIGLFWRDEHHEQHGTWISPSLDSSCFQWRMFYGILGLEARDAVAAEREKTARLEAILSRLLPYAKNCTIIDNDPIRPSGVHINCLSMREMDVIYDALQALAIPEYPLPTIAQELEAERARASKLVDVAMQWEFFEKHANHFIVEGNGLTENLRHAMDYDNWCQALKALAEWKGGQGE